METANFIIEIYSEFPTKIVLCFLQTFQISLDLPPDILLKDNCLYCRLAKSHGKDYGKPKAGSESDKRSKEYQKNVIQEVVSLCYQISLHGFK